MKIKVKIKKWLAEDDLSRQEKFVIRWHNFLLDVQAKLDERDDDQLRKKISMYLLQSFYLEPFRGEADFYQLFERRLENVEKVINQF